MLKHDLDFQDTAIAFADKTDSELKRKYFFFKLMNSQFLNEIGTRSAQFALSLGLPVGGLIKHSVFEIFCGGETIAECEPTIAKLGRSNIGTILDYSIEGKSNEVVFDRTKREIHKTIERAKSDSNIPFSVFKVTGLARRELLEKVSANIPLQGGEKDEWIRAKNRIEELCELAYSIKQPIFIDAEETWIQDAIDTVVMDLMSRLNRESAIVFNTIQFYRTDSLDLLRASHQTAKNGGFIYGVKLVRGAYMEKERERAAENNYPSPIEKDKQSTDANFDDALRYCVEHISDIAFCAGTHNEASARLLTDLMRLKEYPNDHPHVFLSQLYGMSDNLSYVLAKENFNVSKYVPYGPVREALPYLIRRAEENTSVKGQMSRELDLFRREMKRRNLE